MGEPEFIKGVFEAGGIPALALLAVIALISVVNKYGFPHKSTGAETNIAAINALAQNIDKLRVEMAQNDHDQERKLEALSEKLNAVYNDTQVIRDRQR